MIPLVSQQTDRFTPQATSFNIPWCGLLRQAPSQGRSQVTVRRLELELIISSALLIMPREIDRISTYLLTTYAAGLARMGLDEMMDEGIRMSKQIGKFSPLTARNMRLSGDRQDLGVQMLAPYLSLFCF